MKDNIQTSETPSVAAFIDHQIRLVGKPLAQIALEVGFPKSNVISMIRKGNTKLPTDKIRKMAIALDADPAYMLQLTMEEYDPETWKVIKEIIEKPVLTGIEVQVAEVTRGSKLAHIPNLTDSQCEKLARFLEAL